MSDFDKEGFLAYLKKNFTPMDNHFTYDTISSLVSHAILGHTHPKDEICYFLSDIIAEITFAEVAMFAGDELLTETGLAKKREAIQKFRTEVT